MAPTSAAIKAHFLSLPSGIQRFFSHFPELSERFPWEISLSYLFAQIELAQNKAIHGVIVRKHRVDTSMARATVDKHHMTRGRFRDLYKDIAGGPILKATIEEAEKAEKIRDKILHGKSVSEGEKRSAIMAALKYAHALNEQIYKDAGFRAFGDMRGFKGRAEPLDKKTSRWVLIGMGLIGNGKKP